MSDVLTMLVLLVLGAALCVVGVYVQFGLGWALIVGGCVVLGAGLVIRRGIDWSAG